MKSCEIATLKTISIIQRKRDRQENLPKFKIQTNSIVSKTDHDQKAERSLNKKAVKSKPCWRKVKRRWLLPNNTKASKKSEEQRLWILPSKKGKTLLTKKRSWKLRAHRTNKPSYEEKILWNKPLMILNNIWENLNQKKIKRITKTNPNLPKEVKAKEESQGRNPSLQKEKGLQSPKIQSLKTLKSLKNQEDLSLIADQSLCLDTLRRRKKVLSFLLPKIEKNLKSDKVQGQ